MSDHHPYWSYGPDHGVSPVDALNEGRRAFALECAMATVLDEGSGREIVARARLFEAYLAGKSDEVDRLGYLENRHRLLAAMEANGVREWEHFPASLRQATDGQ